MEMIILFQLSWELCRMSRLWLRRDKASLKLACKLILYNHLGDLLWLLVIILSLLLQLFLFVAEHVFCAWISAIRSMFASLASIEQNHNWNKFYILGSAHLREVDQVVCPLTFCMHVIRLPVVPIPRGLTLKGFTGSKGGSLDTEVYI